MGEGVRTHNRKCAICGRTLRLPNFASRKHFTGKGWIETDVHALSHLTKAERAEWWTLPRAKWDVHSPAQTVAERWLA